MDITKTISYAAIETDVALVTVYELQNSTEALATLFETLSAAGVNVNMIAAAPLCESTQTVSFTARTDALPGLLDAVKRLKTKTPDLRIGVNAQNCIATFCGDGVETEIGVSAYVFRAFAAHKIRIKLVTTSKRTVACLFSERDYGKAEQMIAEEFR